MCESCCHNQIIAKIQHFSELLNACILEKETLSIVIHDKDMKNHLLLEILVYEEILTQYDDIFKNILCKEGE